MHFLAHQSTKCLRWAIVIGLSSVHPYVRQQLLKKTSPLKLHRQNLWNFTGSFLGCPCTKYNKGSWLINNNNNNKMSDFLFCLKKRLIWNYMAKFNETSQEASLGVPLQKYKAAQLINNNRMSGFLFCF